MLAQGGDAVRQERVMGGGGLLFSAVLRPIHNARQTATTTNLMAAILKLARNRWD